VLFLFCYVFVEGVAFFLFFFFSSRRRHTRSYGDWSSDVCSSDLEVAVELAGVADDPLLVRPLVAAAAGDVDVEQAVAVEVDQGRSEERRVGKECRSRWWAEQ